MEIKIINGTLGFQILIIINGAKFYNLREFDTVEETRQFLNQHGLEEKEYALQKLI